MRDVRLDDQQLAGPRVDGFGSDRVPRLSLEDNEDFLVSMPVKARALPWLHIDEDEADPGSAKQVTLQLRLRQLVALDDLVAGRRSFHPLATCRPPPVEFAC